MANPTDTGHNVNSTNYNAATNYTANLGDRYQSPNINIKTITLISINKNLQNTILYVDNCIANHNNAVAIRFETYKPLNEITGRILSFFQSLNVPEKTMNQIKFLVFKLQGKRIK